MQHQYAAGGTYVIVLTVSDGTTSTAAAPLNLTLTDGAPIVDTLPFAQPNPASFNQPVTFTASAHDPDGLPLTYMWDFGDNTAAGSGASVQHTYGVLGARVVTLTVSDGTKTTIKSLNVALTDSVPVVDIAPKAQPNPASFNQPITFTVAAHDPDGLAVTYSWDFGDNTPAATGASVQHAYGVLTDRVVTLTVSDGTTTTVKTLNVALTDSAPVIDTPASFQPKPANASQLITFSSVAHDPDGLPVMYSWDFGDNTPPGTGASVQHKFDSAGTYAVTLTVSDGTKTTTASLDIIVNNSPLSFDSPPSALPNPAGIGQSISF